MNNITINGVNYPFDPAKDTVVVIGKAIHISSPVVVGSINTNKLEVIYTGTALSVKSQGDVTVNGNVEGDVDTQGDVTCENVYPIPQNYLGKIIHHAIRH